MGYGVVKHTLGRTMIWVRWLAIAHFVFGLVYAVTSLLVTPDEAGKSLLEISCSSRLLILTRHLRSIDCPSPSEHAHCVLRVDLELSELYA